MKNKLIIFSLFILLIIEITLNLYHNDYLDQLNKNKRIHVLVIIPNAQNKKMMMRIFHTAKPIKNDINENNDVVVKSYNNILKYFR